MSIDPRTPVIIGVAQNTVGRGRQPGPEPLAAWDAVCRDAVADAGLDPKTCAVVDGIVLTDCMSWRYDDPTRRLAERLGAHPALMHVGPPSGTSGQTLTDKAAGDIREGRSDLILVCGGEALATSRYYRMRGQTPPWSHVHPDGPAHAFDLDAHQHPGEVAIGLTEGIGAVYGSAMRDIARRAHRGVRPEDYRRQLGETLASMTKVAARNSNAWFREERSADFLVEPRPDNRPISYPYTKHMTSIMDVDITAAVLIASEEWADRHGVPHQKRVYPWTSCYAEDPVYIAVRPDLWKSHAMEAASKAALDSAGLTIDDITYIDLYSAFTSAINFARDALGIPERAGERVTVTGGMPYAGGPGSTYVLTSIVNLVHLLRKDQGAFGLVNGIGMAMSNHVFAIYSARPPGPLVRRPDEAAVQEKLNAAPLHAIEDSYVGPASVAAYTVMYDRDGVPSHGAAICDLPNGARAHVRIKDAALLREAEQTELVGRRVEIAAGKDVGEISLGPGR